MSSTNSENELGVESGHPQQPNIFSNQNPPYRFNVEELRVLKQCSRESFYQRSLPLSTVLCIGTYYAVKSGFMRGSPSYGAVPKMIVAGIVGYFVGKFSYQSKCAEKLMQLPNSPIGEMLRQRKLHQQGFQQELLPDSSSYSWPSLSEPAGSTTTAVAEPIRELDERPMHDGFENYSRPNMDSPIVEEELTPAQNYTTYEELRRKNREEYEAKRTKINYNRSSPPVTDAPVPAVSSFESERAKKKTESKNKYGDVWEE